MNPDVNRVSATGSAHATVAKYGVTNAAYQVAVSNDLRRSVRFANEGATTIWFGASNNVQAGASALNFAGLLTGSNIEIEHYSGPIWARTAGTSAGASMGPVWLGVVDIG